jgi:hypothetical protein
LAFSEIARRFLSRLRRRSQRIAPAYLLKAELKMNLF